MGRFRAHRQRSRGQALVEIALALPVFLLLVLGLFDVGRGVFMYAGLTNAAREGARLAIVNQDKTMIGQRVQDMALTATVSNLGNPNDLVSFRRPTPNLADPLANAECSPPALGCIAVVKARATWTLITPLVGALVGPINLEARSELPIEFACPNAGIPAYASSASCPRQP
jgi:Flp pilus assembly protein TadG